MFLRRSGKVPCSSTPVGAAADGRGSAGPGGSSSDEGGAGERPSSSESSSEVRALAPASGVASRDAVGSAGTDIGAGAGGSMSQSGTTRQGTNAPAGSSGAGGGGVVGAHPMAATSMQGSAGTAAGAGELREVELEDEWVDGRDGVRVGVEMVDGREGADSNREEKAEECVVVPNLGTPGSTAEGHDTGAGLVSAEWAAASATAVTARSAGVRPEVGAAGVGRNAESCAENGGEWQCAGSRRGVPNGQRLQGPGGCTIVTPVSHTRRRDIIDFANARTATKATSPSQVPDTDERVISMGHTIVECLIISPPQEAMVGNLSRRVCDDEWAEFRSPNMFDLLKGVKGPNGAAARERLSPSAC